MRIRPFEEADRPAVVDLWHPVGLYRPWNDPDRDIDRKVADSPWGMLVGVEEVAPAEAPGPAGECVIATMMVGYDGHRGSVFYLAVDTAHQGQGLGTALMDHAEAMLLERGCPKAHASVRAGSVHVTPRNRPTQGHRGAGEQIIGHDRDATRGTDPPAQAPRPPAAT